MSFLEEFENLTSTAPTVDPELVGWDDNAFVAAKQSQRPYHIQDDAEIGKAVSRSDLYDESDSDIDEEAIRELSENLDGRIDSDTDAELSGSEEDDGSIPSDEQYHTGDSENANSDAENDAASDAENDAASDAENDAASDAENDASDADMEDEEEDHMNLVDKQNDDTKKREALKFQVSCWDKLVQLRIKLQPCLQEVSKLPPPSKRQKYAKSGEAGHVISSIQKSIDMLFDIQDKLVQSNSNVNAVISGKKVVDDDEIPSDTDDEIEEEEVQKVDEGTKPARKRKQNSDYYSSWISEKSEVFDKFKNDTIMEWYEKTKIVARKNTFMNKEVTVLDQINHILSNKDKLITRTIQNRGGVAIIGEDDSSDSHPYLFNDDDFYQQILREIIDKKMGNIDKSDPDAMGKQWVELQKLKIKNKKKNVDTKASKGRKVRYDLHSKLLGFMAPVSEDTLSDARQDELFKSLFSSNV